jgi:hypothetical protein
MAPAEYQALRRAWRKKERRTAELFASVCIVTNRSLGGKLEQSDILESEDPEC